MKNKKKLKKILLIIGISLLVFLVINIAGVPIAYSIIFSKPHTLDLEKGIVNYEEYKSEYPREEVIYPGNDHNLAGYAYMQNTTNYMVITAHGIKNQADSILAIDLFFLDHGYNVFTFDMSGCGKSEGSINGFSQGLIDMEYTLNYLNKDSKYRDYKKLLFGFSQGGYAVSSVLSLNDTNILGVVSVSGYNDAKNLVADKGKQYVGPLVWIGRPIVDLMEKNMFGNYLDIKASDSIKNSTVPVYLAHGTKDSLITYSSLSISAYVEESERIFTYTEETSHSGILYSEDARAYQKSYEGTMDDKKYSELNPILFQNILDFYEKCK